jgi:hypothetical protein
MAFGEVGVIMYAFSIWKSRVSFLDMTSFPVNA